jgi:subtilase family serine protease
MSIRQDHWQIRLGVASLLAALTLMVGSGFAVTPKNLGPEDSSKQISVAVWLNQRNKPALDALVRQMYTKGSPNYHHFLTMEQYKATFAPTAKDAATVGEYLKSHNLSVSFPDKHNHFVMAKGRVSDMQSAFNTKINRFSMNGQIFRGNTTAPTIKGSAAKLVATVQGLNNLRFQPHSLVATDPETGKPFAGIPLLSGNPNGQFFSGNCLRSGGRTEHFTTAGGNPQATYHGARYGADITNGPPNLAPCGYDSAEIQKGYGLNELYHKGWDGTGQTVVIVDAFGSDTIGPDANLFSAINGLPALSSSNFQIFYPTGFTMCGSSCGWNVETSLDVEWAHSVAPGANIALVLAADNSFTNLDLSVLFAIETGLGNVVSNSYGIEELLLQIFLPSELVVQNTINQLGAALGVSVNFSTGDNGDFSVRDGFTTVSMPASSPFATAVGGTSLFLNHDMTMNFQTGWGTNITRIANPTPNPPTVPPINFGFQFGGGGGGSGVWAKPAFQSSLPGTARLVPDISYVGDPFTGTEVIFTPDGIPGDPQFVTVVGGTSLSCPMFSGLWAIANQAAGVPLGQAAPYVYNMPPGAITDVLDVNGPLNVTGYIKNPPNPLLKESAAALAAPLFNTTNFVSALYNSPASTRWDVITFGTDTGLTTGPGWDNVTGVGTPNGLAFVNGVLAQLP